MNTSAGDCPGKLQLHSYRVKFRESHRTDQSILFDLHQVSPSEGRCLHQENPKSDTNAFITACRVIGYKLPFSRIFPWM